MTQEIDLEKYHQLALQKQKEHRKFLATLKKKAPKNLDKIALEIHDEVFQEIDCLACANCCKTLGPNFKEADITRIAKYFKMKLPPLRPNFFKWMKMATRSSNPCLALSWVVIISVLSMMCVRKPVGSFLIRIARKYTRSTI